jgi:Fe2+ transport system protein FeoA
MRTVLNNLATADADQDMSSTALHPTATGQVASGKAQTLPLSELREREARVVGVSAEAEDALRLMALGICVGRRVEIIKAGDPLIVRVVGARVGLSARLAAYVLVAVEDAKAEATTAA